MLSNDAIVHVNVSPTASPASTGAFETGLILFRKTGATEAERLRTYTASRDLLEDGFASTDAAYQAAVKYFSATPSPARLQVSCFPPAQTPAEAFEAVLDKSADFYGVFLCEATDEENYALAAKLQEVDGPHLLFCSVTGTVAEATAAEGLPARLKTMNTRRALSFYAHTATDAAAVMGTAMGLAAARSDAAFALCYKGVNAVEPAALTESQVIALKGVNANVFVTRGFTRSLLENGAVASGLRFDEVYYVDRIASELQAAALELLADGLGKLPQTDETSAAFQNVFAAVLARYTAMDVLATSAWRGQATGVLNPGDTVENGYLLWADSYDSQSDADRAAHKAMPIHAALCFAGSVESLVIDVDVTL